jgi:hypothetical protein
MAAELQALVGQFRYDRAGAGEPAASAAGWAGGEPLAVHPSGRLHDLPRGNARRPAAAGSHRP